MKAYLIDAAQREIRPIDYADGSYFRQYLPGGICIAWVYPNGDVLYVDDEGLLKPATCAFHIKARPDGQPMMSNGILTGRDTDTLTLPPEFTLAEIEVQIEWLTVEQALAWFRAQAGLPAISSQSPGREKRVHAVWADLLRNLEGDKGYQPEDFWKKD
jgi:hypothetical protein